MIRIPNQFPCVVNRYMEFNTGDIYSGKATFTNEEWQCLDAYLSNASRLRYEPYIDRRDLHESPFEACSYDGSDITWRDSYTPEFKSAMMSFRPFMLERDLSYFHKVLEIAFRDTECSPIMVKQRDSLKKGFELDYHRDINIPRSKSYLKRIMQGKVEKIYLDEGMDAHSFGFMPEVDLKLFDLILYGRIYHANHGKYHEFAELEKKYTIDRLAAACHRFLATRYNAIMGLQATVHIIWVNATNDGLISPGWWDEMPTK